MTLSPKWFAACVLLLVCAACDDRGSAHPARIENPLAGTAPRHIVLITMDTLRADHLGCYGYAAAPTSPGVDRLAREGVVFDNAHTPRGETWPALTSLLTGKYPITHGVRKNGLLPGHDETMLMHYLRDAGYTTGLFLGNYADACPLPEARAIDELGSARHPKQEDVDTANTEAAVAWLEKHRSERCFTWLHLLNPHRPYDPPAEMADLVAPYDGWMRDGVTPEAIRSAAARGELVLDGSTLEVFLQGRRGRAIASHGRGLVLDQILDLVTICGIEMSEADRRYVMSRYDAEVRASDDRVTEVLAALDRLDLAPDALVIFSADHGEELGDHNDYFFHGASIYQGVLRVPLVLRWPGHIAPGRRDALVDHTGVLPTVLQMLGVAPAADVEGKSFLDEVAGIPGSGQETAVAEIWLGGRTKGAPLDPGRDAIYAIRDPGWKLVVNRPQAYPRMPPYTSVPGTGFRIEPEELYDLARDPHERTDLLRTAMDTGDDPLAQARYFAAAYRARAHLHVELQRWLEARKPAGKNEDIAEDLAEQFAGLGYVDAAPVAAPEDGHQTTGAAILATAVYDNARRAADAGAPEGLLLMAEAESWRGHGEAARELAARALREASGSQRASFERTVRELGLDRR